MAHAFITIAIPFHRQRLRAVDAVLDSLSEGMKGNRPLITVARALDDLAIVHYMSIVAVSPECPAAQSEDPLDRDPEDSGPAHLMIEITSDWGVGETLALLSGTLGAEFERILAAAGVKRKPERLGEFLRKHHQTIGAGWTAPALGQIHTGSPGMSARRIRQERDLARRIGHAIDKYRKEKGWGNLSPRQRLERVRSDVWEWAGTKWAFIEEPAPILPGDPANPWNDSGYTLNNPQARKALGWILHTLLWPLYVPLTLAWLFFSAPAWHEGPTTLAILWPLFVLFGLLAELVLGAGLIFVRLRERELSDRVDDRVPPSDQVEALMQKENYAPGTQNHMATISRLKSGLLRRLTLRIAFTVVGSGRFVGAPGFLGKNGVIHFARWMRLPGTSQLLFWSNFDNTWESYVADFIADAPSGVTAIWSNGRGFPRSRWLFGGGAEDHDRLVHWARRQQQPTRFWYSAYPDLTADRIRKNAAIRQGLASAASDADARDWLSLFGSASRPAAALDLQEIPTLVFGGLSNRRFAECQIVCLNGDADAARRWLRVVAADATFGETLPGQETAIAVALAASGLRKLEVPADALGTFPTAFQQGMWREWRARELGDTEKNAPETWSWGGNEGAQRADAVVLIYAEGAKFLEKKSDEIKRAAAKHGHEVRTVSLTGPLPAMRGDGGRDLPREPFGFADGVSQPVIRGAPRKNARAVGNDLVAPGEIVLGYPDNIGTLPPSPSLADTHDPRRYLPDRGPDPFRRRPEFSRYEGTTGERDLGANGTFLVVRQLAQDRAAFDISIDKIYKSLVERRDVIMTTDSVSTSVVMRGILQAGRPAATPGSVAPPTGTTAPVGASNASVTLGPYVFGTGYTPPTTDIEIRAVKDLIAAKIVGRWQNGTSLVRNPQFPASLQNGGARPDNAFRLGAEDARGLGCPFGSHIRRANPRDTRFHANTEESRVEIEGVNRHRILRIGRGYDYDDKAQRHAGLFFMCLNADIERQFEFIQKTWLLNRNIHGLENEVDPIMGRGRRSFTIPTPNGPLRLDIDHDFVHMIGGGYFFMPGRAALRYLTRDIQPKSRGPFAGE